VKKENMTSLLLAAFLLLGCGAPTSPTQPSIVSPIASIHPTVVSSPSATTRPTVTKKPPTPTSTSEPELQTNGPYFAYFQKKNSTLQLIFVDANGKGRKVIELPKVISNSLALGTRTTPDMRYVSPDGKWIAFYTGSAGKYTEMPAQGTSDLTLNLFDLETGETQVVTALLSKDYPNNFIEAAKSLNNPDRTAESLYQAFVSGITQTIAWSPDGKYLAFGGQMDGLSSDLYVYEVSTKTIRRLSSGDQELQWIDWSPDGKWIIHSSVYGVGAGMTFDIYAAALDGSAPRYLSTNILYDGIDHWLNDHQYFENDGQNGPGNYGLRLVDINTGNITKVWDGSFSDFVVAQSGTSVLLIAYSPDKSPVNGDQFNFDFDFVPGPFLINLKTHEKTRIPTTDNGHTYGDIRPFGIGGREFILTDQTTDKPVYLTSDGQLTEINLEDTPISVSPNSEYWLAVTARDISVFAADDTLVKDIPFSPSSAYVNGIIWQPDSSGIFLIVGSEIFLVDIPDGNIQIIEKSLTDDYPATYAWINVNQ